MSSTITLSQQVYDLLVQQARQVHQAPDALAESLLRHSLATNMHQWRQRFDALISQIHERTSHFSSQEIEADITNAATEAKELRRARRRRG